MGAEVQEPLTGAQPCEGVVKGRAPDTMDTLVQQTESPFTAEVLHYPLPAIFRMTHVEAFDGVKDPVDHLNTYKNQMELHGYQDHVRCRAFATTLKGPALAWFNRLLPSSISSFRELSIAFVSHFIGARTYRKPSYHLLTVKQGSQESLESYVQRFDAESLKIDIPDEKFAITAFIAELGVQSKDLMFFDRARKIRLTGPLARPKKEVCLTKHSGPLAKPQRRDMPIKALKAFLRQHSCFLVPAQNEGPTYLAQ